jgi:sodium/proline symporter
VADAGWTAIGLAAGTYLNFLFVAKRIRRYSVRLNAITIPSFISKRYGEKKPVIMCIASVVILVFFVPYVASGLAAIGKLFNSLFGWNYLLAVIVGTVVIISYTSVGGFSAVATMDLIQSIIMTCALVTITVFGIYQAGGWETVMDNARQLPGYLSFTQSYDATTGTAVPYSFITVVSTLAWGLGYFGMPHILVRFMAIRDEKELKLSRRIAAVWVVISMGVAICIGLIGYGVSKAGRIPMLEGSATETVIVRIANLLASYGVFPAIVAGLILAGILAATMSTADSQLLAAASAFSENMVQDVFGVKMTEKQTMLTARLTVIVIAVIAAFLATDPNSSVFQIVSFAWAGFGAAFGPVILFALFWKRSNRQGALAGMLVGGMMVFVWKFCVRPLGGAWNVYELLPAFLLASIAIVVVSLATKKPDAEIEKIFDEMNAE